MANIRTVITRNSNNINVGRYCNVYVEFKGRHAGVRRTVARRAASEAEATLLRLG